MTATSELVRKQDDDFVSATPPTAQLPSSQNSESSVTLGSPNEDTETGYEVLTAQPPSSQNSESTITLSSPSQDTETSYEVHPSVECQTDEVTLLSKDDYQALVNKATENLHVKGDLEKLRTFILTCDPQSAEMDPKRFQEICTQAGAKKLFSTFYDAMSSQRMSEERQELTKLRVMVVIYIMMYSQSQKANWFQVSLARTLQQFGISQQGLASLRNFGLVAHPRTIRGTMQTSSTTHLDKVK